MLWKYNNNFVRVPDDDDDDVKSGGDGGTGVDGRYIGRTHGFSGFVVFVDGCMSHCRAISFWSSISVCKSNIGSHSAQILLFSQ